DYNSASLALVNWAKQNLSEDNISVIVVFLTPPAEIAAKSFFHPRPVPQSNAMEQPGYHQDHQADLDFSNFSKQQQQPNSPADEEPGLIQHTNGSEEFQHYIETVNGRHRPKPPKYNDVDDEEEEEEEDDDLGPETNVDVVDETPEEFGKLDQAMGQNYPDEFLSRVKREDDDFPAEIKQRHQNELIVEADNVADSEDSEDEWNYYPKRPEENTQQNSNSLGQSQKDPALVEKPDRCDEEKEPCSPKPCDEDSEDESQSAAELQPSHDINQQQLEEVATATTDDADAEDVITAEFDELHEQQIAIAKDQQQLKELDTEAEAATIPEEDFPYDKEPEQLQFNDQFEQRPEEQQFKEEFKQLEEPQFNQHFEQSEEPRFSEHFEQPEEPRFNEHFEQPEEPKFNEQFKEHEEKQFNEHFEPQLEQDQSNEQFEQQPEQQQFNEHFEPQLEQDQSNEQFEQQPEQQQFNEQFEQQPEQQQFNEQFEQQPEQQQFNEQFEQQPEQQQFNEQFEQQPEQQQFNEQFEQQPEQQQFNERFEQHVEEPSKEESHQSEAKLELELENKIEPEKEVDTEEESDMESHLNPDAAEFVPTNTSPNTSPLIPQIINQMSSDLVAGSPLKQSQRALKNRKIPSEQEFQEEICRRPSEINDSAASDYSNGDSQSPIKDITSGDLLDGFADENQCTVINPLNLDESEISSTRAEFGDETANYSVASEFYKTGLSTIDCSYTGSERSDFDFSSKDPMATSMTPGDFKTAFEQELDLNKVHELNDDDLIGEVQNGTIEETSEKIVQDTMDDDLVKEKIELDFENFAPQQEQNAEVFSAIVEQRESADNNDMFMNLRNNEHGYEFEQNKEERNLIESTEQPEVTSTENEKVAEFAMDDSPIYASNNPFSAGYLPASEQANNVSNLVDDMQKVTLEEPKQQNFEENLVLTPEEPEMQKSMHDEVMHNPLELNFAGASVEQKNDEPVLVTPVKEPQVMSSKFEEEDLMSRSVEALQLDQNQKQEQDEFFIKNNQVEDLSSASAEPEENLVEAPVKSEIHEAATESLDRKSINLSESLQEFTGLEEQLSPKHEVKDNLVETAQVLKENLVDEQKDVEEAKAPSPVPEPKLEEAPQVTNELPVSNETAEKAAAPVVAAAAAAAAVTTAVAAGAAAAAATKPTKSATAVSKASKPTVTSKIGSKSTTPTSPTKSGVAAKTGTTTAAKKPATTSTPRTKTATGAATKTTTSTLSKTTGTSKTTTAPKTATSSAAKTTTRAGATTAAAPRSKPLSSVTSKISSTSATEKKPTANGEVKPPPIGRSAPPPKAKPPTTTTSTASKTGLVSKTSTTTRMSTGLTTSTAPKARPASATTTKSTTSRLSSANVTSSMNSTSARPKTAPTSTLNATAKSKISATAGAKSPMIDKQIKETANKQISSARSSATATTTTKSRMSSVTSSSTSSATKRISLVQKQSTTNVTTSPTKKPPPITKPGSKTSTATSKVNSKVTSTTKTSSAATAIATTTATVVQNGVCEAEKTVEITTNSTTTADTTNIEEDIPKKDISPIEPVTDNQLITAE
ncbi:hypothetical protein TSAR_013938, partial [Trichomalopsis sarcophagae]